MNVSAVRKSIDDYLSYSNRTLRVWPGKLLLGPTGKRLFADYLDKTPGMVGRIEFIHKLNLPGLFAMGLNGALPPTDTAETVWYPSHLHMACLNGDFSLQEDKWITEDDMAVSVQCWHNRGLRPLHLAVSLFDCFRQEARDEGVILRRDCLSHEISLVGAVTSSETALFRGGLTLEAGQSVTFAIVAAMGEETHDTAQGCLERARSYARMGGWLAHQRRSYDRWFDDVPVFASSDALWDTTWWYRWFILRHCWAEPGLGNFRHGVFYEGRSHKNDKELFAPYGHEFSQLVPMSTADHLTDCRWKHDPLCCQESAQSLLDSMDHRHVFRMMMIDKFSFPFGNFNQWALYQHALVHPDKDFIRKVLPGFKQNLMGTHEVFRAENDDLPIAYNHRRTGKEFQPSFWYFAGFPDNAMDDTSYDFLKRVDLSVYLYLNALGTAELCSMVDDPQEQEFRDLATRVKRQVLDKMWDPKTGFFYDLHHETDEKALVKNVVGIYPLWAEITSQEHLPVLDAYFDENEFATGSAFASVSKQCPAFMPMGSWKGRFYKGRDGCMWDGPSWPYTTCIALDAIAKQSKRHGHAYDGMFARFLREYAWEHYRNQSLREPYLVEHYNAVTGEPLSDEADYNHSFFIDLIVRHVAGLEPLADGFAIHPLDIGLQWFTLSNIRLQGHDVKIAYEREKTFAVWVDGMCVFEADYPAQFRYHFN